MSKHGGCDHCENDGCYVNPLRAVRELLDVEHGTYLQEHPVKEVTNVLQSSAIERGGYGECKECVHLNTTTCRSVDVNGVCETFELFEPGTGAGARTGTGAGRKVSSVITSECCLCGAGIRVEVVYRTQCADCRETSERHNQHVAKLRRSEYDARFTPVQ